jgi:hypothetical protein
VCEAHLYWRQHHLQYVQTCTRIAHCSPMARVAARHMCQAANRTTCAP